MISEASVLARYSHWPAEAWPRTRAPSPSLNRLHRASSTTLAISTLASMMPGPGWLEQSKVELRVGSVGALLCGTRRWCKRSSTQRSIRMGAGMVNRTVCWCCHHNSGRRNGCWMRIYHQGIWTWAVREAVHWVVLQDMWRPTSI